MERLVRALKGDAPYTVGEKFETEYGYMNYVVEGNKVCDRPLIVCLHGLNASLAQYLTVSHLFSSLGYRVLRCDLFGHGLSSPWKRTPKSSNHFLAAILKSIYDLVVHVEGQVSQVDVIGFSMGGYIAVEFRNAYPRLVRKLVLISPAGLIRQKPTALRVVNVPIVGFCFRHIVCALYSFLSRVCVRSSAIMKFYTSIEHKAEDEIIDPDAAQWRKISSRNLKSAVLYSRMLQLWNNENAFKTLLAEGPIDILFCWGGKDELTPYKDTEEFLKETLPHAEWVVYDGCQHVLLEEAVPQIYRQIYCFLRDSTNLGVVSTPNAFNVSPCGDNNMALTTPKTELVTPPSEEPVNMLISPAVSSGATATSGVSWVPALQEPSIIDKPSTKYLTVGSGSVGDASDDDALSYVQQRIRQFERRSYFNTQSAPPPQRLSDLADRGAQSACCFKTDGSPMVQSDLSTFPYERQTDVNSHLDELIRRTTSTRETNYSMVSYIMAAKRPR